MNIVAALVVGLTGLFLDIAPNPVPRDVIALGPVLKTTVAMDAEVVIIEVHSDHADVHARFSMRNTGCLPTALEVGFPGAARASSWTLEEILEWAGPLLGNFKASVDGKAVKAICKQPPGTEPTSTGFSMVAGWYLWPMRFAAGEKKEVVVSYRIPTKDVNYTPEGILKRRKFTYILKTGAGWAGPIGSARIVVRFSALTPAHVTRTAPPPTRRKKKSLEWEYKRFEPEADIVLEYSVHANAAEALKVFEAKLLKEPADAATLVDAALAREQLGQHLKAAHTWGQIATLAGKSDHTRSSQYGMPYVPAEHHAARCYRKAGQKSEASAIAASGAVRLERLVARLEAEGNSWWVHRKVYRTSKEALKVLLADLRRWSREP